MRNIILFAFASESITENYEEKRANGKVRFLPNTSRAKHSVLNFFLERKVSHNFPRRSFAVGRKAAKEQRVAVYYLVAADGVK
jgi:hypothetical protein